MEFQDHPADPADYLPPQPMDMKARLLALADEAERKGRTAQAIPELRLVGNAYVGMAQRIRRAVEG